MANDSIEYNLDSFIAKEKERGRTDEELKDFIGKRFGDQTVQLYFDKKLDNPTQKTAENAVIDFLQKATPEAWMTGLGAAGAAGAAGGYAFKSLKDKMAESKNPPTRIEPLMDVNQRPSTERIEPDFNKPAPSVVKVSKDPIEQRLFEISQAQQAAKTQIPMMSHPAPVAPPAVQTAPAAPVAPPVVQAAPAVQPEPTETKKTGGRPPKQAIAPDEEKLTKGQQAMKKHLISLYGNGPEALSAYNQVKEILGYTPEYPPGKGGSLQPEEKEKILQYRKENIAGPKINLTHEMKKAMKAGGGAAALMAIPGFANASTLGEAVGNIGEALLPLGITPSQLAPGTLYTPEQQREFARQTELRKQAERQKLGSPYRSVPPR